ncbi:hypothetical protein K504DRAFT_507648 [Pleomassaria siparia CBS 279.74]|uniref:Uncharacterized protein n=1 Tax=Pleomassaria siparia CBS 279.74 TaxID=1314801 RepID=A0A6G1JT06_9PLEO|nr:hypothetical protein K504DRAFT_507648 [Pleomassaria siparia CBS 279.74]
MLLNTPPTFTFPKAFQQQKLLNYQPDNIFVYNHPSINYTTPPYDPFTNFTMCQQLYTKFKKCGHVAEETTLDVCGKEDCQDRDMVPEEENTWKEGGCWHCKEHHRKMELIRMRDRMAADLGEGMKQRWEEEDRLEEEEEEEEEEEDRMDES